MMSTNYYVTNLMLSDAIARRYGLNRAAAVKRCAKRTLGQTDDPELIALLRDLMTATVPETIRIIDRCWGGWVAANIRLKTKTGAKPWLNLTMRGLT